MKKIWPFSFYFLYYAAASGIFPYAALYYKGLQLSGAQIGLLLGLSPLITLIGAPLFTGLADATRRHKLVISLTLAGVILWALVMPLIHSFPLLLLLVSLYALVSAPIMSLADSATMSMLGEERAMYGRIRLGGTLGWGLMAYFTSLFVEQHGRVAIFWICAAGMTLTLLAGQGLTFGPIEKRTPFWKGISRLLVNPRWILFLALTFVAGVGIATINSFQFVYMAEIGASNSQMGLSLTLSTLSELPAMFFGHRLLKRFGAQGLLILGTAAIGLRLLLYSTFNYPVAILILQVLHGLTFPLVWIAGVTYADENSPAGLSSTAQGLFGAALFGFGAGLGSFFGGLLVEALTGRGLYLVMGLFVTLGLAIFTILRKTLPGQDATVSA